MRDTGVSSLGSTGNWTELLDAALPILDTLPAQARWTLGGGAALMLRHQHRISNNIHLYLSDAAHLAHLSPRRNRCSAALAAQIDEQEGWLRLSTAQGAVTFVAGPRLTDSEPETFELDGRTLLLDPSAEVMARKLHNIAELGVRDVFDLAVVVAREPAAVQSLRAATHCQAKALEQRLADLAPGFDEHVAAEVTVLPEGEPFLSRGHAIAASFVASLDG